MSSDQNNNEQEKYKHDIEIIKNVILKVEEKAIFETWVFFTYGVILFLGAVFNILMVCVWKIATSDILIKFWVPIFLVAGILEPIALVRKLSKEALPLLSKTIIKLYLGIFGCCASVLIVLVPIFMSGNYSILPSCFLCLWAIVYLFYAQIASPTIFLHAFTLIIAGLILLVTGFSLDVQIIVIAFLLSISSFIIGITDYRRNKKPNE